VAGPKALKDVGQGLKEAPNREDKGLLGREKEGLR
jgi:hypothetical protein